MVCFFLFIHLKVFYNLPCDFFLTNWFKNLCCLISTYLWFSSFPSLIDFLASFHCHWRRYFVWFQSFQIYWDLCGLIYSLLGALEKNFYSAVTECRALYVPVRSSYLYWWVLSFLINLLSTCSSPHWKLVLGIEVSNYSCRAVVSIRCLYFRALLFWTYIFYNLYRDINISLYSFVFTSFNLLT